MTNMSIQSDTAATAQRLFTRVWAYLMLAFGALFLTAGLIMYARENAFGREAVATRGTVVELRMTDSGDGPTYAPIVEFATRDGRAVRFEGTSTNPHPEPGDTLALLYRPTNPGDARIDSVVHRWLMPAVFAPLGAIALVGGALQMIRLRATAAR
jgi:hypothetical protein